MGRGKAGREHESWLNADTLSPMLPLFIFVVVFFFFPPFHFSMISIILFPRPVRSAPSRPGKLAAILHGHTHRPDVSVVGGTDVVVMDPGSSTQVKGGHGARCGVYDIATHGAGGIENAWSILIDPKEGASKAKVTSVTLPPAISRGNANPE